MILLIHFGQFLWIACVQNDLNSIMILLIPGIKKLKALADYLFKFHYDSINSMH